MRDLAVHLATHLDQLDAAGIYIDLHRSLREYFTGALADSLPNHLDNDAVARLGELGKGLYGKPGPGGGFDPADAHLIAMLVLSSMIFEERDKVAAKTIDAWAAWPVDYQLPKRHFRRRDACPLTNKTYFGDAFAAILADQKLAVQVDRVEVSHPGGEIRIWGHEGQQLSRFMMRVFEPHKNAFGFVGVVNFYGIVRLQRFIAGDPEYRFGLPEGT
jgi:hypothetical protein